jgi:hypothetical protein
MKTDPLAVPSDVVVIKSTSGGAQLEAAFQSTREQSKALRADGFSWCKEDMVLLRVHVLPEATVADLVAIGALCASYAVDECLLRTRAFLCPYAFGGAHQACKAGGFAFRKGVGWAKAMGADEWRALQSVAGTLSAEAAERRRVQAEETAKEEEWAAARERAAAAKAANLQRRSYDYGKLLLQMSETGSYVLGSDGAPNWPDPPLPGEKGIVSKATEHLVPPRPQWTGTSVHSGWML